MQFDVFLNFPFTGCWRVVHCIIDLGTTSEIGEIFYAVTAAHKCPFTSPCRTELAVEQHSHFTVLIIFRNSFLSSIYEQDLMCDRIIFHTWNYCMSKIKLMWQRVSADEYFSVALDSSENFQFALGLATCRHKLLQHTGSQRPDWPHRCCP